MQVLRIGVLGAARIAPAAVVRPARQLPDVAVTAIAARDRDRAERFARRHRIPTVHSSYDALLADRAIDAVYIPLPNGLHAEWTLRAIAAGKHVLCEKPFTANAAEAEEVAAAARDSGLVVTEAFHYRYHALAERMRSIVHGGEIGALRSIRVWMCFPLPLFGDIRYNYDLAGGALMDAGCYAVHCLRLLGPGEPTVVEAKAKLRGPNVDRAMTAHFRFADGVSGRLDCSMWSWRLLRMAVHATGERGEMRVFSFVAPQAFNLLRVTAGGRTHRERVSGEASYTAQLRAFATSVRSGAPSLTPANDAVVTMRLIDDIYRAAGLPIRGDHSSPPPGPASPGPR